MFTYYIAATLQSIATIVQTGCFPSNLPLWLEPKRIICTNNITASIKTSNTNFHQIFILTIEVPFQLQDSTKSDLIIIEQIDPAWITQIFTYSERGQKSLKNLLRYNQYVSIVIVPEVYESIQASTLPLLIGPTTRPKALCFSTKPPLSKKPITDEDLSVTKLRRISSKEEHLEILRSAFRKAKNTILITSYAITHNTLQAANLYPLIEQAIRRGVKIYCYYNDAKQLEQCVKDIFTRLGVIFDETYTHSKILAVDHTWVALGSFNWLSAIDDRYPYSMNASIVCKGEICPDLIEDLWEYLKHYRDIQFGRYKRAESFDRNDDSSIVYEIAPGEEITYLTNLDEQLGFFQSIFEEAKERIVICAPFISSAGTYEEEFNQQLLYDTVMLGVKIFFICPPDSQYLSEFNGFLASVGSSKIHLLTVNNFHLKTIVVDDDLIAEGSFNWLSAARDADSDYHNHEAIITVKGNVAKELIVNFYDSEIGRMILSLVFGSPSSEAPQPRASEVSQEDAWWLKNEAALTKAESATNKAIAESKLVAQQSAPRWVSLGQPVILSSSIVKTNRSTNQKRHLSPDRVSGSSTEQDQQIPPSHKIFGKCT